MYMCCVLFFSPAGKYCKQGWVAYGNYCYLVKATKTDAKKYTDAVTACKAYTGGNLASIHSAAELGFIMAQFGNQNASGRVYIGITDLTVIPCLAFHYRPCFVGCGAVATCGKAVR